MNNQLLTLFIFSIVAISIKAQIINVPNDYAKIQHAIDASANGDTILVDQGVYYENIDFSGKNITVASNYIYTFNHEDIANTIIRGDSAAGSDTASCVLIVNGEDSTASLKGFTISGGTGTHWIDPNLPSYTWHSGGGLLIFNSSPTVQYNAIVENHVDDATGVDGASGGGICVYGGNPLIANNIIKNNTALYGAGLVIDYAGGDYKNNIIESNIGGQTYGGGGIWVIGNNDEQIRIDNNTIIYNQSVGNGSFAGKGGAMLVWMGTVYCQNNIIWGNTQSYGDQIYTSSGTVNIEHSCIEDGYEGIGNIESNPEFYDDTYCLNYNSPCIDAGNSSDQYNDIEDVANPGFALWPSRGLIRNDMGAYGGSLCKNIYNTPVTANDVNIKNKNNTIRCYPNPFKEEINIELDSPKNQFIEVFIYDPLGRLVENVFKGMVCKGTTHFNWQPNKNQYKGAYFIQVIEDNGIISKKIIQH